MNRGTLDGMNDDRSIAEESTLFLDVITAYKAFRTNSVSGTQHTRLIINPEVKRKVMAEANRALRPYALPDDQPLLTFMGCEIRIDPNEPSFRFE